MTQNEHGMSKKLWIRLRRIRRRRVAMGDSEESIRGGAPNNSPLQRREGGHDSRSATDHGGGSVGDKVSRSAQERGGGNVGD